MVIFNNMAAMSALNETNRSNNKLGKVVKQASSGMRINSAGDDASGYSISEKMRVQLRALSQDIENVQTGHNLVATAEGGIQEIIENLRYLKEKAINAANDHNTDADRELIQKEVNQRIDEINDIASSTTYNGRVLLNGNYREYVPASTTINIDYNFKANTLNDLTKGFSIVGSSCTELSSGTMGFKGIAGNKAYASVSESSSSEPSATLEVDFNSAIDPGGSLSYPSSFDGQGFCMGCAGCKAYINIEFDASRSAADSVVYIDDTGEKASGPHGADQINWSYAYVIGIKDVTDSASLNKAFYDGVIAANDKENSAPEGWDVTVNNLGEGYFGQPWSWTHNTRIAYNALDRKVYLRRDLSAPNWVFYDKGAFHVDVSTTSPEDNMLTIHTGTVANQNIKVAINDMHAKKMGVEPLDVGTQKMADFAINKVDFAIEYALNENTRMGAYQARLRETEENLVVGNENTTAAESVIRDADMARVMMEYAKCNILQQSSQSMLAQANQTPSVILGLLQ